MTTNHTTPRHPYPLPPLSCSPLPSHFPKSAAYLPILLQIRPTYMPICYKYWYTFSPPLSPAPPPPPTHTSHTPPCAADNLLKLALYPNDSTCTHTGPHMRKRAHADDWCGGGIPGIPGAIGSQALDKLSLGDRGQDACLVETR